MYFSILLCALYFVSKHVYFITIVTIINSFKN